MLDRDRLVARTAWAGSRSLGLRSSLARPLDASPSTSARDSGRVRRAKHWRRESAPLLSGLLSGRKSTVRSSENRRFTARKGSRRWDSNPRPADYESAALPTELRRLGGVIGARSQRAQTRHFSTAAPPLDPKNLLTSRSPVERKRRKLLIF